MAGSARKEEEELRQAGPGMSVDQPDPTNPNDCVIEDAPVETMEKVLRISDAEKAIQPGTSSGSDSALDAEDSRERDGGYSFGLEKSSVKSRAKKPLWRWLFFNPLKLSKKPPIPETRQASRECSAGFFSQATWNWMTPLMVTGYQRPLEVNDLWLVNPDRAVDIIATKLQASFTKRVVRGDRYPLAFAIYETLKFEFWLGGICQLISSVFQVLAPYLLRYLITFAEEAYDAKHSHSPSPNIGRGLGLIFGITIMQVLQNANTNQFLYRGMLLGGQSRAALIALIFEKAMKISPRAKAGGKDADEERTLSHVETVEEERQNMNFIKKMILHKIDPRTGAKVTPDIAKGIAGDGTGWANGRIVNLMSVDTARVDTAFGMFHMIWTAPISIMITIALLLVNLTYSALAGLGLLFVCVPLLGYAIKLLFIRRRSINKVTDQRVSLTQEILAAVRFVKFFGWEKSFLERLRDIRKREIRSIQVLLAIRNAINAIGMSLPVFASMLAFITYYFSNHSLNPAPVFSSLALFNALRLPLFLLPLVIGQVTDAWASIGRIQEFLLTENQGDDITWNFDAKNAIEVRDADFTWERQTEQNSEKPALFQTKSQLKASKKAEKTRRKLSKTSQTSDNNEDLVGAEPFQLRDINFAVGRTELVAVIGRVGCGKSSLLAAFAGEMRKTKGELVLGASRAFCPQYAWIRNASVRENIIFGKDYDEAWYNQVIDACALRPDLEILPNGDLSEIGERGITLSGGQKQRLSIARAIYYNSDIILLEDPLAAVDSHVGKHIFDHAICGLLRNKCRVLATHQLHVLQRCDRIVVMQEGKIETIGTFEELMRDNKSFRDLLASTSQEGKEEKNEEEEGDDKDDETIAINKPKSSKPRTTLMQEEERAVKAVPWSVYSAYIKASGSFFNGILVVALLVLSQCANVGTSLWLSYWTSDSLHLSEGAYVGGYAGLGATQCILMYLFATSLSIFGTNSSRTMLQHAMTRVLRAPMSFFDTTPLGRITNRFSKDVDTMDNNLTDSIRMYFMTIGMMIAVFALIITFFHWFAVALVPLFFFFLIAASYYRASAREVKRHESVLRSNVYARFSEGISGTSTIRAYSVEKNFIRSLKEAIDNMDSAYFLTFSNQRWLSARLDVIGNLLVFITGLLVVTSRFSVSPSISGLVLSYILTIVQMIQFCVRQLAEVENGMNSTERLLYYGISIAEEPPLRTSKFLPPSWPDKGEIVFSRVDMRYRPNLPLVLSNFTLHVAAGERIGIVGRTGAGKSSIMSALFRLVDLSAGSISIDGVDISDVGLSDLRSRLAIIPQDPTLFRGTVRSNLDPFNEHTDLELWGALRQADLVKSDDGHQQNTHGNDYHSKEDASQRIHLDTVVEEEGLNFSLGQRQLMALARALVRNARIIVCDEATSSVDIKTDTRIQQTMARGFHGKTLLCIAHRLRTIIGYDRIVVMDKGSIAEVDTPINLFDKKDGIFRSMCVRSGISRKNFFDEEYRL